MQAEAPSSTGAVDAMSTRSGVAEGDEEAELSCHATRSDTKGAPAEVERIAETPAIPVPEDKEVEVVGDVVTEGRAEDTKKKPSTIDLKIMKINVKGPPCKAFRHLRAFCDLKSMSAEFEGALNAAALEKSEIADLAI